MKLFWSVAENAEKKQTNNQQTQRERKMLTNLFLLCQMRTNGTSKSTSDSIEELLNTERKEVTKVQNSD